MPSARRTRLTSLTVLTGLTVLASLCGCTPPGGQTGSTTTPSPATPSPTTSPTTSPTASPSAAVSHSTSHSPTPSASTSASPSATSSRPTASPSSTTRKPVIVIDPGHSGRSIRSRTRNGLLDFDYPNAPEMAEMFDISSCLAQGLRADGYRVVLTKTSESASVSLTERARIADRAHADLAVSLHDDHSQGPSFQATYSQLGVHGHPMYRGTGSHRTVFDQPSVARASARAAKIIAQQRARAQSRPVRVTENIYTGRAPLEPGNLALVQLLSHVPWVYNEMGALTGGSTTARLSLGAETGYAKGVLDGIETAVPLRSGRANTDVTSTATLRSCLRERRS